MAKEKKKKIHIFVCVFFTSADRENGKKGIFIVLLFSLTPYECKNLLM
jgi:hypothetical protein